MWPVIPALAAAFTKTALPLPAGGPQALPPPADACTEVARVITGRRDQPEEGSYTNKLLAGGDNRILKKIGEEGAEFVMACKDGAKDEIAGEAADLIFHMQVALAHHGVEWRQVLEGVGGPPRAPRRNWVICRDGSQPAWPTGPRIACSRPLSTANRWASRQRLGFPLALSAV